MFQPFSTRALGVTSSLLLSAVFGLLVALTMGAPADAAGGGGEISEDLFRSLKYRHIGPVGNRVIAVVGVPGDPNVAYFGAASGGIFKTTDGGVHWQPIFDQQRVSSIGSLAIAPSDPNVLWAGTGETFIRANISIGNGVYRSTDGGDTWRHLGLEKTGRIGRMIVHPTNPDVAYAAALGHCYGPQEERGVYRTTDGGQNWQRVLFAGENAGASDLVMDPNNPRILFAGTWEMEVSTWSRRSGGPQSGLWRSGDGGDTWQRLEGDGLPEGPWGKIGLTMSAADSRRIYALIETSSNQDFAPFDAFQGVLWRSDDSGSTWQMVSADNNLVQRPLYYSRALAAPDDADEVYFMSVRHSTSLDGGRTAEPTENQPGWDHHDMWIDPLNPKRMIVGHDGGVSLSTNRGQSWMKPQLPIAQMYHVHVDDQIPYYVYGNRQDGPAVRGPSNSLMGNEIPIGAWHSVGGCEVGFAIPSPADSDIVWTGCYDGILERYDHSSGHARNVSVWPDAVESWPGIDLRYRFQWTFPMAISPHDPERVYVGSQYVHRTTNGGQSWTIVSPDLTTNNPEFQQRLGGLTLDDAGPTLAPTVFAIAESALEEGLIWAGTNDGKVQLTRDGGENWTDVTDALTGVPPHGTVSNIEPSPHDAGTAYLTIDRHQLGDTATYVFKTTNYGQTWHSLRGDLPQNTFSYAHCLREDPVRPGLLYLGIENGLHVSFDDGDHWHRLGAELPPAPVHWLVVQEHFHDLVVATYGRGFWILDDITPLRQMADETFDAGQVQLFVPRSAYRFHHKEPTMSQPEDPAAGTNPQYGAPIHYLLSSDVAVDEAEGDAQDDADSDARNRVAENESGADSESPAVEITILDAAGNIVRGLEDVPQEEGLHRVYWDLRYDKTTEVKLRTKPAENPLVPMPDKGWRPLSDGSRIALLAPPGTYTVRLKTSAGILEQEIKVLKDPNSAGSEADIRVQFELLDDIRDAVDRSARMINAVEWTRKQLEGLAEYLTAHPDTGDPLHEERQNLAQNLAEFEGEFFDLRLTGAGQDSLRWKRLLYARLGHLAWGISRADYVPTDAQVQLFRELQEQLSNLEQRFVGLQKEVDVLNSALLEKDIEAIQWVQSPLS